MSACNTGWRVSDDKRKCLANVCVCPNGVASSGEKCATDGDKMCESCDNGFKLRLNKTACDGISIVAWERLLYFLHMYCICVKMCAIEGT